MECIVKICYGLKVVFQTENTILKKKKDFREQKSAAFLQLKCGVSQDSILGPLLLYIYIYIYSQEYKSFV